MDPFYEWRLPRLKSAMSTKRSYIRCWVYDANECLAGLHTLCTMRHACLKRRVISDSESEKPQRASFGAAGATVGIRAALKVTVK